MIEYKATVKFDHLFVDPRDVPTDVPEPIEWRLDVVYDFGDELDFIFKRFGSDDITRITLPRRFTAEQRTAAIAVHLKLRT